MAAEESGCSGNATNSGCELTALAKIAARFEKEGVFSPATHSIKGALGEAF